MPTINLITEIPGPKSRDIVARRERNMPRGVAKLTQIAVAHAQGAVVTDVDGNTLLDFAGGIGTLAIGHNHPSVVGAVQAQAANLIHMSAIVATYEPLVGVAERLNALTPGDFEKRTSLHNSGSEAVETAMAIARSYTGRPGIIVFEGAYHGRTNLTLSMTSKYALFKKGFGPFAPEVYRLPFPNLYRRPQGMGEAEFIEYHLWNLENALTAQVDPSALAAIVLEPVQGEGGFVPVPAAFIQKIRALCTQHNIVMVADEIQCGFGRTGKLFASEHYNVVPDIVITAKSLGGGMPLSAVTGRADIMDAPHPGGLGGTYSGNPLACAAAIEAIDIISQPEFLARANQVGDQIRACLNDLQTDIPHIGDVRGLGPMLAMELVHDRDSKKPYPEIVQQITKTTLERGLITLRAGLYSNCVRFLPPLNIPDEQLHEGLDVFA
ncbi:MAG: 4-aminobutyrate--2-oxoglutarate transaminase, partial [Phototrophicaceae bacterium]